MIYNRMHTTKEEEMLGDLKEGGQITTETLNRPQQPKP
jgi:hypothetical protein